jgi:hypothetical protein
VGCPAGSRKETGPQQRRSTFCGRKAGAIGGYWRGPTEGWINLYRIFRPDIVVADYAPTANTFFNSAIEQLVGLARRHAVPVIYMRRELHRMWLDGDTPTTRSRPTRPAFSARRTCASLLGDADYLGNSLTDLDRPRTSVPGRTSRHRKESAGR